jgi:hypothetical protein
MLQTSGMILKSCICKKGWEDIGDEVGGSEVSSEEKGEEEAAEDNGASYNTCLPDEERDFKDMAAYEEGASEGSMCEDRVSVGTACGKGFERHS